MWNLSVRLTLLACLWLLIQPAAAPASDAPPGPREGSIKTIVIDPGHGGVDTGAIGPTGVEEKAITLGVARALKKHLVKKTKAHIFLTRTDDSYVSLEERTDFANSVMADVFISIHVNASRRRAASGVETFFLSFEASDDEARETAAFENNVIRFDETAATGAGADDLKAILWDLAQTEAHHESSRLAETLQEALSSVSRGENRGVKQAQFIVLYGATMPAVLVEIGFITNPKDEKRLSQKKTQYTIADAISDGVATFEKILRKRVGYVELDGQGKKN
jgi:N-acetylmuramoyl-L-alanine amidase